MDVMVIGVGEEGKKEKTNKIACQVLFLLAFKNQHGSKGKKI